MNIRRLLRFEKQALLKSYSEIYKQKHDLKIWHDTTLDYQNDPHSYSKSSMMF